MKADYMMHLSALPPTEKLSRQASKVKINDLRSSWILAFFDFIGYSVLLALSFLLRISLNNLLPTHNSFANLGSLIYIPFIIPLAFYFAKLYPGYGIPPAERLKKEIYCNFISFGIALIISFSQKQEYPSRSLFFIIALIFIIARPLWFGFEVRVLRSLRLWGKPVAILGSGTREQYIAKNLIRHPECGLVPTCFINENDQTNTSLKIPILKTHNEAIEKYRLSTVVLSLKSENFDSFHKAYKDILLIHESLDIPTSYASIREIGGLLGIHFKRNLLNRKNKILKRVIDLSIAAPLSIATLPIVLIFGVIIYIIDPGSIFFIHKRVGLNGKLFSVVKLRTMYQDSQQRLEQLLESSPEANFEWTQTFKLKNDPRILPIIGKFIRKFSIDELPQLWNVLIGEMSLVGPRPFPIYHVNSLPKEFQAIRERVTPGITGYWQIMARSDSDILIQEKLDNYYILNWSLWLDWFIVSRTIICVLCGKGAY